MRREGPLAIVAGNGRLPIKLADHLASQGEDVRIVALRGFADAVLRRRANAHCDVLDPQALLQRLEAWSPRAVTLAGGVTRPGITALIGAFAALRRVDDLKDVFSRGDDHVLRTFVSWLEDRGLPVVGVHELMPGLTAPRGFHAGAPVAAEHAASVTAAIDLLRLLSPYDVGQAVVIAGQRVLAIEGPEGTDRMLRRVARLRRSWFSHRREGGILVKAAKQGQDLRVDVPAIGPRTIIEAARAGLSGIFVGAESTLILDREETAEAAARAGLFVASVDLPWARRTA